MENTLSSFFKKNIVDSNSWYIEPQCAETIYNIDPELFEIKPKEFLEYSYQDFELDGNRSLINALSNVKRAIECQSDIIHFSLGMTYKNISFPMKIENIQKMGISPAIFLKHINNIRVDLEHFYKIPDRNKVEDAIQIAQLFLDVTTLSLTSFWSDFQIYNENEEEQQRSDENFHGMMRIYNGVDVTFRYPQVFRIIYLKKRKANCMLISSKDKEDYLKLINLSIDIGRHMHNFDEKTTGKRLFQQFLTRLEKLSPSI
jgi:hypothetical protein